MRTAYIAHPLGAGPDRAANLERAARWCVWAAYQGVAPVATWVVLASQWDESPAHRELGLEVDCELVRCCDELWLVGGRVSPGMQREREAAERAGVVVVDLTHLGEEPPT